MMYITRLDMLEEEVVNSILQYHQIASLIHSCIYEGHLNFSFFFYFYFGDVQATVRACFPIFGVKYVVVLMIILGLH